MSMIDQYRDRDDPNLRYDRIKCRMCFVPWPTHAEESPQCVGRPPQAGVGGGELAEARAQEHARRVIQKTRELNAKTLGGQSPPPPSGLDGAWEDVMEFHRRFAPHLIGSTPAIPTDQAHSILRFKLVKEEYAELILAGAKGDLAGIADACADLIYVVIGLAITFGIDLRPVWRAVQVANMSKEGGPTRADGKICKPEGWCPPDIDGILANQDSIS